MTKSNQPSTLTVWRRALSKSNGGNWHERSKTTNRDCMGSDIVA
jgi:hypothetical protein